MITAMLAESLPGGESALVRALSSRFIIATFARSSRLFEVVGNSCCMRNRRVGVQRLSIWHVWCHTRATWQSGQAADELQVHAVNYIQLSLARRHLRLSNRPGSKKWEFANEARTDVRESPRSALVLRLRSDRKLGDSMPSLSVQRPACRESSLAATSRRYSHAVQAYRGRNFTSCMTRIESTFT